MQLKLPEAKYHYRKSKTKPYPNTIMKRTGSNPLF